jgi:hypothetical protein
MQDRQRNKLNMYVLVKDLLLASTTITAKWTAYAALFARFESHVNEIFTVAGQQTADKSGTTKSKIQVKKLLIDKMEEVSEKCRGYATVEEDFEFLSLIKFMKSDLQKLADADLVKTAETFHANVLPKVALVAEYELTPADLATLLTLKNDFLVIYTMPRDNVQSTAQLTARLNVLFELADAVLLKIDAIIQTARKSEPTFVETYNSKRTLTKTATRTRALKLTAVDDATGLPIAKAKVKATTKAGSELWKNVKLTGAKGGITDNLLSDGEYNFEVSYGGYVKETGSFFVNEGTTTDVEVRLKKV